MNSQEIYLHAQITPVDDFQMKPFSSMIIDGKNLICASNDGRIFQFDIDTYDFQRSISVHSSWIPTMFLSDDYFATGSYDTSIMITTKKDIFNFDQTPDFVRFDEHVDYILSICISKDLLISASSEPKILISRIGSGGKCVKTLQTISLENSIHSMLPIDNSVLLGANNGSLSILKMSSYQRNDLFNYESAIKVISENFPFIAIGCLDGKIEILDYNNNYKQIATKQLNSRIVSIYPFKSKFVAFTANGNVYDLNDHGFKFIEINKDISFGACSQGDLFHIAAEDNALFCINLENSILRKVNGGTTYIKAVRIPQTTKVLCKTKLKEVSLWNLVTFEMEEKFINVSFKTKLKELSKSPSYYFPVSFDISNGSVNLVIPPILPKLIQKNMEKQRKDFQSIFETLINKNVKITSYNLQGKALLTNNAEESVPNWFRYILDPKFIYN